MAGLSAGEVFVNLVVRGGGVKPALAAAQAQVKQFGTQITALSVATGNLISQGVTMALGKLSDVASFAWEKAKMDPRTAGAILELQRNVDKAWASFAKTANVIIEAMLPAMNAAAQGLVWVADQVQYMVEWLDEMGVTAALQTGDFSTAFSIMWKEVQIAWLSGYSVVVGVWDKLVNDIRWGVDYVTNYMYEMFSSQVDGATNYMNGLVAIWGYGIGRIQKALKGLMSVLGVYGDKMAAEMKKLSANLAGGIIGPTGMKAINSLKEISEKSKDIDKIVRERINKKYDERTNDALERQKQLEAEIAALREASNEQAASAVEKRNIKRIESEANFAQAIAGRGAVTSVAGTFALGVSGGNVMYQTQKDILRELREQKDLQRKQLDELKKDKGPVFAP